MIPDFIKKIPSRITLFVMQSEKFRSTVAIALLAIAVCYGLQWLMLGKVPEKLAFFIDGFSYTTNKLTVGKGSDISFSNVPADYLSIERVDSSISKWTTIIPMHISSSTMIRNESRLKCRQCMARIC